MKQVLTIILRSLVALFMIFAGVQHFMKPDFYLPFVPSFLPFQMSIVYLSGVVEIVLGLGLLLHKKYARYAALGLFLMMVLFLPIHLRDVFSATPAIGSHSAALIRLPIQFIFIVVSWIIYAVLSRQIKNQN